jgi:hypothetical protein
MNPVLIKLTSGEDIIAKIEGLFDMIYDEKMLPVFKPMAIKQIRIPTSQGVMDSYTLTPWSTLTDEEIIHIPTAHVIMAAPASERVVALYESYLQEKLEPVGASQEDPINDDLSRIQELFDELEGVDDEDEAEDRGDTSPRRYFH